MNIHRHLIIFLLSACLSQLLAISAMAIDTPPTNTNAGNNTASKDDLSVQKELFQLQLDAKKELLQKDIEAQATRIDAFEKRIDDQNSRISDIGSDVDRFGVIAGIFGTLITLLLVLLGYLGYRNARNDAKEMVEVAAKEASSQWFDNNHKNLNLRMEELEDRVTQACEMIDSHNDDIVQKTNEFKEKTDALFETQMEDSQRRLSQLKTGEQSEKTSPADNSAIEQKAKQLKQKPESQYTFTDWNTRAFAAVSEGKLEDAIFYWDKAIRSSDIQPQDHAQTMFNKAIALGQLNCSEEAIATYDALIDKFGTAEELALREHVTKAMYNKGTVLGQMNRSEEAITAYDLLINQFVVAKELSLCEAVVKAMFNKGFVLRQLNRSEEAIATYDAVITQFSAAEELSLREQVAVAMHTKGYFLSQLNRSDEAIAAYDAVIIQFGAAEELAFREISAKAMHNRGNALGRLNRSEEAIAAFDALINKFDAAEELVLREQVANAWSGKGFSLMCIAKANWENTDLANELLVKASDACKLSILKNSDNGSAHGNLAYITWLQGNPVAAEQHFRKGLASAKNGGEALYKATLTDFDIHPIEPDQGFRELVEKLWAEYQQSHNR